METAAFKLLSEFKTQGIKYEICSQFFKVTNPEKLTGRQIRKMAVIPVKNFILAAGKLK